MSNERAALLALAYRMEQDNSPSAGVREWVAELRALAEQPAGAVCPDCAAAVLYECPACSATNYPDRPDAIGSGIGELRRVLRMVFDAYRDNEARLPPLVAGCVEGALIGSDSTTPPAASVDVEGFRPMVVFAKEYASTLDPDAAQTINADADRLLALIDTAGGAKGEDDARKLYEPDDYADAFNGRTPQPAEGDGAVVSNADVLRAVDVYDNAMGEGWQLPSGKGMRAVLEDFAATSRPAATAVVPDAPIKVFDLGPWIYEPEGMRFSGPQLDGAAFAEYRRFLAAAPAAPKGGVDAYTFDVIEEAWGDAVPLTRKYFDVFRARLAELRKHSLANQEQRHDALADGEAASG